MGFVVGGEDAWKVRNLGDIVVAYHWVNDEPAMVLYPRISNGSRASAIIGLSAAYKYADSRRGEPTAYLLERGFQITRHLGMVVTSGTVRKVVDAIVEGLPDLIAMPPEPPELELTRRLKEGRAGEVVLTADGEKIAEFEA